MVTVAAGMLNEDAPSRWVGVVRAILSSWRCGGGGGDVILTEMDVEVV